MEEKTVNKVLGAYEDAYSAGCRLSLVRAGEVAAGDWDLIKEAYRKANELQNILKTVMDRNSADFREKLLTH